METPSRHHRSGHNIACSSNMKRLFFVVNYSKSLRTVRGSVEGSGREYNLVRQFFIVSSSGTLVNKEHTSKEHIVSLLCLCDFAQSTKVKKSLIVNWLVEIALRTVTRKEARL